MLTTIFSTVLAGGDIILTPGGGTGQFTGVEQITVAGIVTALITLVLVIAGVVFFFMLVWGGISWIMSGGDKAKTEAARNRITAALIGMIVLFSAWAIVQLIQTFLGIEILNGLQLPTITRGL